MTTRQVYTNTISQTLALNSTVVRATFVTTLYQIYGTSTYNATTNKSQAHLVITASIDTSATVTTNSFNAKVYNYQYPNEAPNWAVGNKTIGTTTTTLLDQYCDITHTNDGLRAVELRIGTFTVQLEVGSQLISKQVSFGNTKVWFSAYTRTPVISVPSSAVNVGTAMNVSATSVVNGITVYAVENGTERSIGTISSGSGSVSYTCPTSLIASYTTQSFIPISFYGVNSIGTGSTTTKNFDIPNTYKPSVTNFTYSDISTKPSKYTQLIQNISQLQCTVTAQGNNGSTIQSYETNTGINRYSSATFTTQVLTATSYSFSTVVTDSRSKSSDAYITSISCDAYALPIISNISVYRCDSSGNRQTDGTYARCSISYSISALNNLNTKALSVSVDGGSATSVSISAYSGNNVDLWALGYQPSGLTASSGHTLTFTLTDDFSSYVLTANVSVSIPHMDFAINDNGDIGVGVGAMATPERLTYNDTLTWYHGASEMDYVIAHGTSGNWYWQKWNSGLAEAYEKHDDTSVAINGSTNGTFYKSSVYTLSLPNIFISTPCVQMASYCSALSNNIIISLQSVNSTQITYCHKSVPSMANVDGIHVDTIVKGRWKQ